MFHRVVSHYEEVKVTSGTMSCEKFYKHQLAGSGAGTPFVPGVVFVGPEDFIADVEMAAKKILTPDEFVAFKEGRFTERVEERLGREFKRRKIYPLHEYFQPKDLRRK